MRRAGGTGAWQMAERTYSSNRGERAREVSVSVDGTRGGEEYGGGEPTLDLKRNGGRKGTGEDA